MSACKFMQGWKKILFICKKASFAIFYMKNGQFLPQKNGVDFCQGSNGTIRSSITTSCDVSGRRASSPTFDQSEASKKRPDRCHWNVTNKPQIGLGFVQNAHRNLPLKFDPNWVSNSWDIVDIEFAVVVGGGGGWWCWWWWWCAQSFSCKTQT